MTKPIEERSLRHLQALSRELEVPKVLDEKQLEYMDWLILPRHMREPATKQDMAEVLGTTVSSLKRWENLPHFKEAYRSRVMETVATPERVEEAARVAFELGFGDAQDHNFAKIWMQMAGIGRDTPLRPSASDAVADMTDEELDAFLFDAAKAEKQRRARSG